MGAGSDSSGISAATVRDGSPFWRRALLRPRCRALVGVSLVGVPVALAEVASRVLTTYWWFGSIGYLQVFWQMLAVRTILFILAVGVAFVCPVTALLAAARRVPVQLARAPRLIAVAACLVVACAVGLWAGQRWQLVVLWMHRSQFGTADPVHHLDVSFFVFTLPVLDAGADIAVVVAGITGAAAVGVYVAAGALSVAPFRAARSARPQLARICAIALLAVAARIWLVTYSIEVSRTATPELTAFPGADYVDVQIRIPVLELLAALTVLCAAVVLIAARLAALGRRRAAVRVAALPAALAVSCAFAGLVVAPWLAAELLVAPQPLTREQPELSAAIEATRRAFALDHIEVVPQPVRSAVPRSKVAAAVSSLANVQVWDSSVLAAEMRQLGERSSYFRPGLPSLEIEDVHGQRRLSLFSPLELDPAKIPDRGGGWADSRIVYTHGLGGLLFSASAAGRRGEPVAEPVRLRQPRIYFGDQSGQQADWVVVSTRRGEADAAGAGEQASVAYHYSGDGGIELSSWIRRAALAIRLGSLQLLLSDDLTSRSRVIIHRDVVGRLTALASFVHWDPAVTAVPASGGITYLVYGYTTSTSYPQSESVRLDGQWVNYARASVVATVSAFSGAMHLYQLDGSDPILKAWAAAFPGLFQRMAAFPVALRPELRYPQALFDVQAELEEQYHARSPAVFASGADIWDRPTDLSGQAATVGDIRFSTPGTRNPDEEAPYYRLATAPGQRGRAVLLRTALFTPLASQNIVAELDGFVAATGQLRLSLAVPRPGQLIYGPAQITRLVVTTPAIARALALTNKETTDLSQHSVSSVVLGMAQWQFVDGTVVQIQPVYLQGTGVGVGRMLGVTAYADGRAVLAKTLRRALLRVLTPP
jgi:uncharacterized protein